MIPFKYLWRLLFLSKLVFLAQQIQNLMNVTCFGLQQDKPTCVDGCCQYNAKKCYIIDDYGYVFLSGNRSNLGRHISAIDGALFQSMTQQKIFMDYRMAEYQATCNEPQVNNEGDQYPVDNEKHDDDLIKEYNTARPCTKEYSVYRLQSANEKKWRDLDLTTVCYQQIVS